MEQVEHGRFMKAWFFELESVFVEAYLRIVPNLGINFGLCFQIPGW